MKEEALRSLFDERLLEFPAKEHPVKQFRDGVGIERLSETGLEEICLFGSLEIVP